MRPVRPATLLPALALIAVLLLGLFIARSVGQRLTHYRTPEELARAESNARSWVPKFVPKSAYDFYEFHEVDEVLLAGRLSFPGEAVPHIRAHLGPITGTGTIDVPQPPIPGWLDLRGNLSCDELRNAGYEVMWTVRGAGDYAYVALVDWEQRVLTYWKAVERPCSRSRTARGSRACLLRGTGVDRRRECGSRS